jgi:hypothetical protein
VRVVPDLALDAACPCRELFGGEDVVQTQHPLEMVGGGEVGRETRAADELRRRIWRAQFGVVVLERL